MLVVQVTQASTASSGNIPVYRRVSGIRKNCGSPVLRIRAKASFCSPSKRLAELIGASEPRNRLSCTGFFSRFFAVSRRNSAGRGPASSCASRQSSPNFNPACLPAPTISVQGAHFVSPMRTRGRVILALAVLGRVAVPYEQVHDQRSERQGNEGQSGVLHRNGSRRASYFFSQIRRSAPRKYPDLCWRITHPFAHGHPVIAVEIVTTQTAVPLFFVYDHQADSLAGFLTMRSSNFRQRHPCSRCRTRTQ